MRDRLLKILNDENICNRIWIPAKVYEEFLKNRSKVLAEQWSRESKIQVLLNEIKSEFEKRANEKFSSKNPHPYINIPSIISGIEGFVSKQVADIENEKNTNYSISFTNDSILKEIIRIFKSKVGFEFSKDDLHKIIEEGEIRYKQEIPPGFMDIKKNGEDKYSDLIIWKSIITYAKEKTNIIFVIDDKKNDWWQIESGKTIGLLPFLRREFEAETGKKY